MPDELETRPKTLPGRVRDWFAEMRGVIEGVATRLLTLGIASVATKQATKLSSDSLEAMNEGLTAALHLHRAMRDRIAAEDPDERDLFEMYRAAALAHTRLCTEAINQGIAPQPIDADQLARPIVTSLSSQAASPGNGVRESIEVSGKGQEPLTTDQPPKRKRGRPSNSEKEQRAKHFPT